MGLALMVVRTAADIVAAADVLRAGHRLAVLAEPGHLYGPELPVRLDESPGPGKARYAHEKHWQVRDLAEFLLRYLNDADVVHHLHVEAESQKDAIREAWEHLNWFAARHLDRLGILKLIEILARAEGGTIEPLMTMGDTGWEEYVKWGRGALLCWQKPGPSDLAALVRAGTPLINAARLDPGFLGMCGAAPLPEHGLIRVSAGMAPLDAYTASGQPTGLGPAWDSVAARCRLLGLPMDPRTPLKMRQDIEMDLRTHARRKSQTALTRLCWTAEGNHDPSVAGNPQALTRMWLPRGPESVVYLHHNWEHVLRVDFSGSDPSSR